VGGEDSPKIAVLYVRVRLVTTSGTQNLSVVLKEAHVSLIRIVVAYSSRSYKVTQVISFKVALNSKLLSRLVLIPCERD
jgi:hypothetical protein